MTGSLAIHSNYASLIQSFFTNINPKVAEHQLEEAVGTVTGHE